MWNKKYNTFSFGLLIGSLIPLCIMGIFFLFFELIGATLTMENNGLGSGFRIRTFSLISLASNAVLMQFFRKRYAVEAMRGITLPTFFYIVLWLIYFSSEII